MGSKASDDFPEPETPDTTVNLPWVKSQQMFFRMWVRATRMVILSFNVSTGELAVDLLGGRFNLCLKPGFDASKRFHWIAFFRLLKSGGNVARQISEHHSPGFRLLPHSHTHTDVLILMCDPDTQKFEGFGVGASRVGHAELIGLSHVSSLGMGWCPICVRAPKNSPQGLKPANISSNYGTTKVVS